MAGAAERESEGPQTPPSKIGRRQATIPPEHKSLTTDPGSAPTAIRWG